MKSLVMTIMMLITATFAQAYQGQGGFAGYPDHRGGYQDYRRTESFRQTCDVVYEDYRHIQAYCEDTTGRDVYNDFYRASCRDGDIANIDGRITCVNNAGLPPGSYQMTCTGCQVNYPTLSCSCRDTRNNYHYTSLYLPNCRGGDISNMNGRLVCQ